MLQSMFGRKFHSTSFFFKCGNSTKPRSRIKCELECLQDVISGFSVEITVEVTSLGSASLPSHCVNDSLRLLCLSFCLVLFCFSRKAYSATRNIPPAH